MRLAATLRESARRIAEREITNTHDLPARARAKLNDMMTTRELFGPSGYYDSASHAVLFALLCAETLEQGVAK